MRSDLVEIVRNKELDEFIELLTQNNATHKGQKMSISFVTIGLVVSALFASSGEPKLDQSPAPWVQLAGDYNSCEEQCSAEYDQCLEEARLDAGTGELPSYITQCDRNHGRCTDQC